MTNKFIGALGRVAHRCSEFGDYFMSFQRKCIKTGRNSDCEGKPTLDDARRDYLAMMRWRDSSFGL